MDEIKEKLLIIASAINELNSNVGDLLSDETYYNLRDVITELEREVEE